MHKVMHVAELDPGVACIIGTEAQQKHWVFAGIGAPSGGWPTSLQPPTSPLHQPLLAHACQCRKPFTPETISLSRLPLISNKSGNDLPRYLDRGLTRGRTHGLNSIDGAASHLRDVEVKYRHAWLEV